MPSRSRSPRSADWRDIASLGEQIVNADSLAEQRDHIVAMTSQLIRGEIDVWLCEKVFRLPNLEVESVFPEDPELPGMQRAIKMGQILTRPRRANGGKSSASRETWAALPIIEKGVVLGALQVTRKQGPEFKQAELDLLEQLAGAVSISLVASHRVAVERFRLNQLDLVRQVSEQIANALSIDELAQRVTELIQQTFHYYYVAIFTVQEDSTSLRFRSSAMVKPSKEAQASHRKRRKSKVALEVEIGQGLVGLAAASGERVLVDDVQNDSRYRFVDVLPETRSEVALPLKIEGRVLGVLDVQSDQANAFHPNDLLILEALTASISRAIEGARLYSDLRRRANQLSLIAEVSKSVSASLDLFTLMENVAALIHERFGYPHVHLFTVHPIRRLIAFVAGSGERKAGLSRYTLSLDDPKGIIPWVAREGKTVLANDVRKEKRFRASPLPPQDTRSELCVPLIYHEQIVGILDIQSAHINAFTHDDLLIFEAVADNIATAIHNVELYRTEQWRRQVGESLREVAGLISADAGVDDVFEAILSELDRNLPVDISAIWLLEDDDLYLAACHNCDESKMEQALYDSPDSYQKLMEALYSDMPLVRKPTDPIWITGIVAEYEQDYSALAVPLRVGDQPYGVITLAHSTPGRYGQEAKAMTTTFASYAAVAIENARLYDMAQEQAYASAALLQVAQAVVSLNDLDEILGTIIRIMPILVGVERAALYQWNTEKENFEPSQQYGLGEDEEQVFWNRSFAPGEFTILDACRDTANLIACQLDSDGSRGLSVWLSLDPRLEVNLGDPNPFLFAVPIGVKDDLYGVMLIEEATGGLRFRSRRLEIITGIAQQAALAIQNDLLQKEMVVRERLETEVQLARQIQQTFIPETLPQFADWELAARWKTARQVGGDFYDVFDLPNRRLGLFIADVADKGVPAALFMALTRTLVRAAVTELESPAEAMKRVNDLLIPDTKQGMFVTAIYAVLNMEKNELTYVNAGHNPPLWIKCNGEIERLRRTGIALGAAEEVVFDQRTIPLEKDDNILLYTDGLTESFNNDGEFFGEERLIESIQTNRCSSASELLDVVETALLNFVQDMPPADDLTMLVLRRV
ncbi:MAG TPA: GAF domain-containing protein [Anaerolineales bacterium]|jgi:serine phosphatase RsbU (regulator of sigma subunit)/putative methionine-R-sulfoxide reductase with GAF domain|nr:GAF domain-containing protein [Anaerolineales bacterium]